MKPNAAALSIVLLLAISATTSFAAVAMGFYNDPKNPGKCTVDKLILSPGDIVKDPNQGCGRIICGNNGATEFQTCGVQRVEGCKMGDYVDKTLQYPDCCKRHWICN